MKEELRQRIGGLSPEQRARFEAALRDRGLADTAEGAPPVAADAPARPELRPPRTARDPEPAAPTPSASELAFSLFFFSGDGFSRDGDKYGPLLEAAEWADAQGFHAVWVPERHFHGFGGLYPNPAVLAAAIAMRTRRIGIRAGSVVMPLHHPARVAEDWAMLDNLSGGRVGVSLASGWVPEDFVLAGAPFEARRTTLLEGLVAFRRLWRGETVPFPPPGGGDPVAVRSFPRPLQPELPVWLTTSGSRETWIQAGRLGLNVLTGLLRGTLGEVAGHAAAYREARREAGHDPESGRVTLMIHTFVGRDEGYVRAQVREPLLGYIRTHMSLYEMQGLAGGGLPMDVSRLTPDDREAIAEIAFERYLGENGLFGTVESCLPRLARIRASGIDEIGCLVDFGLDRATMTEGLGLLAELRDRNRGGD